MYLDYIDQFIDCHCDKPYSKYKTQIDNIINCVLK